MLVNQIDMSSQYPAIRCKIGPFLYYLLALKASDLVNKAKFPHEMPDWENMTMEERQQRDINISRVKSQIAPYLATDKRRFFGSIIVLLKGEEAEFKPLSELIGTIPQPYCNDADDMGFLTFSGDEIFLPIDGQHRLKALQYAIIGSDDHGKAIEKLTANIAVAKDQVSIILLTGIKVEDQRKIFTSVNKYAKPTTTGQNLVMDDNDVVADISRRVTTNIFTDRLVNYKSNTLLPTNQYFTTLAIIAKCVEACLTRIYGKVDRKKLPDSDTLKDYRSLCFVFWKKLLDGVKVLRDHLKDKTEKGDSLRKEGKKKYIILRPAGLEVCFRTFDALMYDCGIPEKDAIKRLNQVDWTFRSELWDRLLYAGKKIQTKNTNLAVRILTYYLSGETGPNISESELLKQYLEIFPLDEQDTKKLPILPGLPVK